MERSVLLAEAEAGLEISSVDAGNPAESTGLLTGDVCARIAELDIPDQAVFQAAMGEGITALVIRKGQELQVELTLAVRC
ncbi:MAG: C-terminal processing protease CtpA/Prc [Hyphomicrobiaceae bacterium]|jgi:C-terminal processing protease CtpA/Prc